MLFNYPIPFFVFSIVVLWVSANLGARWGRRRPLASDEREDYGFVQAAALTLLGLIIGFSFSMATGRYDERRNYEEGEANAIGTEFVRVGVLPAADAVRARALLKKYTDLRISFYETRNTSQLQQIDTDTGQLQTEMWSAVQAPAVAQPTAVTALALSGMNDVLNSQGYTQAAWLNRIPVAAWCLMLAIAIGCNVSVGYGGRTTKTRNGVLLMLPVFVAVAFLLIADIDSPRWGLIHVPPENLQSLSQSLAKQ